MRKRFSPLCICLIIFNFSSFGQEPKALPEVDDNYTKYFDDGVLLDANGNVKFNVFALVEGFVEFSYEQKITKNFSICGEGSLSPVAGVNLINNIYGEVVGSREEFESGFGYGIEPRYYGGYAITRFGYGGLMLRQRHVKYENVKEVNSDIALVYGVKKMMKNNFNGEMNMFLGIRNQNVTGDNLCADCYGIKGLFGFNFKLGYLIKL